MFFRSQKPFRFAVLLVCALLAAAATTPAQDQEQVAEGNKPERVEWFRDLGLGLFVHWSLDSQIGSVISHSLAGASDDYVERDFNELPKSFNPEKFDPDEWAALAKLAGFQYVVFTAKHHSGFCMYDTDTTGFSIMNTPYGHDLTAELVRAFREQDIAIGFYFSPDDFYFLHQQGKVIARRQPGVTPQENPELMEYDKAQLRELLTQYGKVDVVFIDGPAEGLRELCWEIDPDVVVTRGAMVTPEQYTPGVPLEGPWEGNLTIGTQWQYKPTHETYKSGTELIETWIETRAKGGNLLLNIGPKPDGVIPVEQEARLRELALWNFINGEAMRAARPWVITNEDNVWFTRKKGSDTVYAIVAQPDWPWGTRKTIELRSVKATEETEVSVLGQSDKVLEYRPEVTPETQWEQDGDVLRITATRAQRIHNDRRWPNPVVLRITNAEQGLTPPRVVTRNAGWRSEAGAATLRGRLESKGDAETVEVSFEYRRKKTTTEMYEPDEPWKRVDGLERSSAGEFSLAVRGLDPGRSYEFRAVAKHPKITIFGATKTLEGKE